MKFKLFSNFQIINNKPLFLYIGLSLMVKRVIVKKITIISVLLLIMSSLTLARKTELQNPPDIVINNHLTTLQVNQAIVGALSQQDWKKEFESSNESGQLISASYYIRTHHIKINILFNQNRISFQYADSENMNYKQGRFKKMIHPNYFVWTQQLAKQIEQNVLLGDAFDLAEVISEKEHWSQQIPKEPFANFSNFELSKTTWGETNQGYKTVAEQLDHHLDLILQSKINYWSQSTVSTRTLTIKPTIVAVRLIDPVARKWFGSWDGRLWLLIKLDCVDNETNEVVASPLLFRKGGSINQAAASEREYEMIKSMAADIRIYLENNYHKANGGGRTPPAGLLKNSDLEL